MPKHVVSKEQSLYPTQKQNNNKTKNGGKERDKKKDENKIRVGVLGEREGGRKAEREK